MVSGVIAVRYIRIIFTMCNYLAVWSHRKVFGISDKVANCVSAVKLVQIQFVIN